MKIIPYLLLLFLFSKDDYKKKFQNGIASYNEANYIHAIDCFTKSYQLKKHSKTSYYIAMSYFKLAEDSLAEIYAIRAQHELPTLPNDPYQLDIQHIYEHNLLKSRFKKVKLNFTLSDRKYNLKEGQEAKRVLSLYYSQDPEGQRRLQNDFYFVQNRTLANEKELKFDSINLRLYREPIFDSLTD